MDQDQQTTPIIFPNEGQEIADRLNWKRRGLHLVQVKGWESGSLDKARPEALHLES